MVVESTLAAFLKGIREARGMRQAELGLLVGYGQTGVSNIECGRNQIGASELGKWCDALNMSDAERLRALKLAAADARGAT